MGLALDERQAMIDSFLANTGTIGSVVLLSNTTFTGTCTIDAATDTVTTSTPHGMVTGSRMRIAAATTQPAITGGGNLVATVDYFAIVFSATTFKPAATLALALAGTAINLSDSGSGTLTLTEQPLSDQDSKTVLLNKELPNANGYTRAAVTNVGAAIVSGGNAVKNFTVTVSAVGGNLVFRHLFFLRGGNTTIGDTTGTRSYLATLTAVLTVVDGTPQPVVFQFGQGNIAN